MKLAVITGGTRGIGAAILILLNLLEQYLFLQKVKHVSLRDPPILLIVDSI